MAAIRIATLLVFSVVCVTSAHSQTGESEFGAARSRHAHLIDELMTCAQHWVRQLPPEVLKKNRLIVETLKGKIPFNLEFIPLLEPYVSYLASLQMPGREDTFLQVFSDFCDKEHGARSFISCMRKQPNVQAMQLSQPDTGDVMAQIYDRYCDSSGAIHNSVIMNLLRGKHSKAVQRLSRMFVSEDRMFCSDVVESYVEAFIKDASDNRSLDRLANSLRSGVEAYAQCVMVTLSKKYHAKQLQEHLNMVLLRMFGSNTAILSQRELGNERRTVALVGYNNIQSEDGQLLVCPGAGTRNLIENKNLAVTGTLRYQHVDGALLPYLAAVHIRITLYKPERWEPQGQVTYTTGLKTELSDILTTFWWSQGEMVGRMSSNDHGVTLQSYGSFREITDSNSGSHIVITKSGDMLSIAIRMSSGLLHQSRGLLLDECLSSGHAAAEYGVLPTTWECKSSCNVAQSHSLNSVCRRDCQMSNNHSQVSDMYRDFEQMIVISQSKDDLLEQPMNLFTSSTPRSHDHYNTAAINVNVNEEEERVIIGSNKEEQIYYHDAAPPNPEVVTMTTTSVQPSKPTAPVTVTNHRPAHSKRLRKIDAALIPPHKNTAASDSRTNRTIIVCNYLLVAVLCGVGFTAS